MAFSNGDKLGPYEILAKIGAGGMGEVYRARDPRLGRDVAIKVSAERFSERFDREARAVAALNHPNICAIYDVGPNYIVMEFIAGEAPKGPLPLEEVLRIARQIGDRPRHVVCPDSIAAKKGETFTCRVIRSDGNTVLVKAVQRNDKGDFVFAPASRQPKP